MSSTITLSGDWLINIGNRNQTFGTGNLGIYTTNGIAVTATQLGLGSVDDLVIDPAGGYVFSYDKSAGKVRAYLSAGFTPAGTNSAPTITTGTNAGTTAPVYTNGGALTQTTGAAGITGVQAPTFTGTAVAAAAMAEVANGVDLSGVTFRFRATGR